VPDKSGNYKNLVVNGFKNTKKMNGKAKLSSLILAKKE
jgi:hypothetical protein